MKARNFERFFVFANVFLDNNRLIHKIPVLGHGTVEVLNEANRQVEKWSAVIIFMMTKMTNTCAFSLKVSISMYNYYVKDLGSDAFQMTYPVW